MSYDPSASAPWAPYPSSGSPWQPPPAAPTYAHWGKRVGATLIDSVLLAPLYVAALVVMPFAIETTTATGVGVAGRVGPGGTVTTPLAPTTTSSVQVHGTAMAILVLLYVLMFAIGVWNHYVRQGRTGATVGKSVMGIRLVSASTGRPIGIAMTFVRQLAHFFDALPCYLGFLWPLWDARRQTFADKICGTVVLDVPTPARPTWQ